MQFWHDQQRDILLYPTQAPFLLRDLPDARLINGHLLAVPRTLANLQVLRFYDHPVPPPVTDATYDFPIEPGRRPLAHQRVMCNFMVLHRRCFNLSDMGTMKTLSALWAADYLMREHERRGETFRALVVAPLSTLETVWANAIFKNFLSRRTFEILHGDAGRRLSRLSKNADFFIVNPDGVGVGAHTRKRFELDGFSRALAERVDIRLAIIDEASAYKDAQTKRHRIARLVFGRKEYLWLLTGTPTPNAPTDAYGLAKLVNNAWGKSFKTFQLETMLRITEFRWVPQKDGYDKARKLLSPAIRYDLQDVWDGPEMTTQQREVDLTPQQVKLLAELKRDLRVVVKEGTAISAPHEAGARQKFMQISLGAIYDSEHEVHLVDARPRLNALKEVIEQAPGQILIFAGLTSIVNLLYRELREWTREVVNGAVGQAERTRIFQAFQSGSGPRLLIADPRSMGHGVDLWQARTVVWYGTTDQAEIYQQANRRAHRPGQRYPVSVVQLVSTPLEREIYKRLDTNASLQGLLLEMVKKGEL